MSRAACEKITTFVLELQVLSGFSTCVLALLCIILPKYQQILKEFNVQLLIFAALKKTSEDGGVVANEQATGPELQWDITPERDDVGFGHEDKKPCAGEEL